ncbi:MAG TPA: hypothetical protein DDX39_11400 [Bacteroidales bacterium]|nr:MAG: hypothetical protein A2W98_13995 [Bacteroidetes bacterium GWF2_33_38]OFY86232.1 MAG: hypothetical protein A2236_13970 [Bacteroidetes bacterium RIFOXYA2_FULL_33_7]HBF89236.1 hypothetical protein [Bacteroidales bacterium]
MKKTIFLISFLLLSLVYQAQELNRPTKKVYRDTTSIDMLDIRIGYHGVVTFHPGIKVGVEYPLRRKIKEIPRYPILSRMDVMNGKGSKTIRKELIASLNSGMFYHRQNHSGFFINFEAEKRRTGRKGKYRGFSFGLGMLRTFLGPTYELDESDQFKKVFLPGRFYFMPSFSYTHGWNFMYKKTIPTAIFYKLTYFMYTPYNNSANMNFAFELGLRVKMLKNHLKHE